MSANPLGALGLVLQAAAINASDTLPLRVNRQLGALLVRHHLDGFSACENCPSGTTRLVDDKHQGQR